jgi:hypothetical protein
MKVEPAKSLLLKPIAANTLKKYAESQRTKEGINIRRKYNTRTKNPSTVQFDMESQTKYLLSMSLKAVLFVAAAAEDAENVPPVLAHSLCVELVSVDSTLVPVLS